jgi:hypothetical protein
MILISREQGRAACKENDRDRSHFESLKETI